jgi:hypothetical protein
VLRERVSVSRLVNIVGVHEGLGGTSYNKRKPRKQNYTLTAKTAHVSRTKGGVQVQIGDNERRKEYFKIYVQAMGQHM